MDIKMRSSDLGNYIVYENGQLWSKKKSKFLLWQDNSNGYKKVVLFNPKAKNEYVHRLVAIAFVPNPFNYKYIDHIDRNKENNDASNLRWVTAQQNTNNTAGQTRYKSRRTCPHHSKELIGLVKQDYISGMKVMEISRKYNIARQSVSRFIKS